ncbi:uncharacterized protein N7483_011969 [Penicillium malachiteum]|uniref:uncharacterized protein n=1 Tax=Penicillium malachiteum TaxID=1324776 RepID=UPI00254705DD|nr:uncharacterized protein N7483_011969 [Penicillium malachiteum]KAJ5714788.1 hypothetical protein N7483_011969 [Penicillium malachiteum]
MDILDAYLSPGSILVAIATLAFFVNGAWAQLFQKKQTDNTGHLNPSVEPGDGDIAVSKEPEVPGGWWDSREVFELERRAIFSKSWLYLAHITQFAKPGAYQSFDIAGFPIFLIRGKDDKIRAFHNVCRHRAYTITRKETGASTVLGCRYHGWSYDTLGRLVKAPQFDDVPGFDKSENSLFEIHAHTTEQGWVFVNLDTGEPGPFEASLQASLEEFKRDSGLGKRSEWVTGQTLTGSFNWKLGATDRHFKSALAQLEQRISETLRPSFATQVMRALTLKNKKSTCSLFPRTLVYSFEKADLALALTLLPASETTTQVRYDIFDVGSKEETDESTLANTIGEVLHKLVNDMENVFESIAQTAVESSATTHKILKQLREHQKMEKIRGGQILPAMRQPKGSPLFQRAEQLCKELDCSGPRANGAGSGGLDW